MYTDYSNLPDTARIWIYQSNRELTQEEVDLIGKNMEDFINSWTRHGDDLRGSYTIKYNQFIVIAVDENFNNVSGCSIDSSVHFIQSIEKSLNIDLTDKMNISFKDGEHINLVKLKDFQAFAKAQKIHSETIVFNNMVNTKKDFEEKWEVPAKNSWHKRFLTL